MTRKTLVICVYLCASVVPLSAAQFGRPASDISTGPYFPTPLWQQLDEVTADDDTTTATSGNNPNESDGTGFEVKLSAVTDPLSSNGHIVRIRAKQTAGSRNVTLNWRLYQGTTAVIGAQSLDLSTSKGSYFDDSHALSGAEADAISDYSDLRVRVWGTTVGSGSPSQLVVTWIEFEAPDTGKIHIIVIED